MKALRYQVIRILAMLTCVFSLTVTAFAAELPEDFSAEITEITETLNKRGLSEGAVSDIVLRPTAKTGYIKEGKTSSASLTGESYMTAFSDTMEAISETRKSVASAQRIIKVAWVCMLIFIVCALVGTMIYAKKQKKGSFAGARPFELPPRVLPGQTVRWLFSRRDMTEEIFIRRINGWLQANPNLSVKSCGFRCDNSQGWLTKVTYLNGFELEYAVNDRPTGRFYGVDTVSRFAFHACSAEEMVAEWQAAHPGAVILSRREVTHQRTRANSYNPGGIGDNNRTQVYLFYTYGG